MFRRRQAKTHGRLMREEFGESFEHFRMAVAHAAGGTADLVRPRVSAAKQSVQPKLRTAQGATLATVMPLALMARGGVRQAGKAARKGKAKLTREEPRVKRWPMMLGGLLAAGAAVGATGALIARRRANRSQWEEYGTARPTTSRTDSMIESAKAGVDSGREKVQSLAESAKERAADLVGSGSSTTDTGTSTTEFGSREDRYGRAGTSSNNNRP